ncbi:MAG: SPOR domain-containing protein [Thermomonas sp.]|uniref:SPOR domain-containing protein n=1 Tax=Thermomonas sp. TaxID=1971895 RepID=UPI00263298D1|nr:SPOR domain-containing protein [Thermomonas sp.]MCC7096002.1 SPOR domain-containing protein [Thermomonas sp.]
MATRRGKSQARRNGSASLPGWAWLLLGAALTLAAVLVVPRLLKPASGDGFLRVGPIPNPNAQPTMAHGDTIAPDVATDAPKPANAEPPKPRYDFYTLLPGEGVQLTDAELAASAKAEAEARARAAQHDPNAAAAAASDNALPTPIGEPGSASTANAAAPVAEPATSANAARYILQAGAFGASGDAEAVKAKIALLGLSARVESAQVGDRTVYRVRMGPYGTASELAEAKAKLSGGGLPAMAIKAK